MDNLKSPDTLLFPFTNTTTHQKQQRKQKSPLLSFYPFASTKAIIFINNGTNNNFQWKNQDSIFLKVRFC